MNNINKNIKFILKSVVPYTLRDEIIAIIFL